jgi:hypothetical protein
LEVRGSSALTRLSKRAYEERFSTHFLSGFPAYLYMTDKILNTPTMGMAIGHHSQLATLEEVSRLWLH